MSKRRSCPKYGVQYTLNKEDRVIFYASSISTFKDLISTSSALSAVSAEWIAVEYLKATSEPIASEPTELLIWVWNQAVLSPPVFQCPPSFWRKCGHLSQQPFNMMPLTVQPNGYSPVPRWQGISTGITARMLCWRR